MLLPIKNKKPVICEGCLKSIGGIRYFITGVVGLNTNPRVVCEDCYEDYLMGNI